jgi:AraC-like DNA-binding protein
VAALARVGLDTDEVLRPFGLTTARLAELEDPVPLSFLHDVWQSAAEVSGEPGLGVRIASSVRPETYELFGSIVSNSATVGDALLRATRLTRLVTSALELTLLVEEDRTTLTLKALYPELLHRESTEFVLAAICVIGRRITGQALVPDEVRFSHPPPSSLRHHAKIFGAAASFGRPESALIFDNAILCAPVLGSDAAVCAALEREAKDVLDRLPQRSALVARVQELISAELRGGNPNIEHIAEKLGTHQRTLTRKLKSLGTSHQQLLDQLRHQLAERYLRQPSLTLSEIAFLLGYSDPSAFNKAFKRWTGSPPRQYRAKID